MADIHADMKLVGHLLDDFDAIARTGFAKYQDYPDALRLEHSSRTAANSRYDHMVAEADRRFDGRPGIIAKDIRGLKVWLIGADAVIRLKMMDEDGRTRNYPTKQALTYDKGQTLPGLPLPAIRLTVGYLLDPTQTEFVRTQVARPNGKRWIEWNAAIVPATAGKPAAYEDVTRQGGFG